MKLFNQYIDIALSVVTETGDKSSQLTQVSVIGNDYCNDQEKQQLSDYLERNGFNVELCPTFIKTLPKVQSTLSKLIHKHYFTQWLESPTGDFKISLKPCIVSNTITNKESYYAHEYDKYIDCQFRMFITNNDMDKYVFVDDKNYEVSDGYEDRVFNHTPREHYWSNGFGDEANLSYTNEMTKQLGKVDLTKNEEYVVLEIKQLNDQFEYKTNEFMEQFLGITNEQLDPIIKELNIKCFGYDNQQSQGGQ